MSALIVAKGLASFVLPQSLTNRSGGRTHSARYCYAVFLRHLVKLAEAGLPTAPRIVAEIGPGESVGTGLAALAAGAERYVGLDVKHYSVRTGVADLFDEIVALLRQNAPLPGAAEFPTIKPEIAETAFPTQILSVERMASALAPARVDELRRRIAEGGTDSPLRHVAPWQQASVIERGSVDWIFSQAVMEHVEDVGTTYAACRDWLRPGGIMTHQIDLKSHGTAAAWNGHWAYSDALWRIIRGRRLYLINRLPASAHRRAIEAAGFAIVAEQPVPRRDGIARKRLSARFAALSDDDLTTSGLFIAARRADA
jgi:SAM-dependent methyltransferase